MNPAAKKLAAEKGLDTSAIAGSGKDGRVLKEDVVAAAAKPASAPVKSAPAAAVAAPVVAEGYRVEKRVPMTRLRSRIAERLLEASQNTAMLTTFNEVNMGPVMALPLRLLRPQLPPAQPQRLRPQPL